MQPDGLGVPFQALPAAQIDTVLVKVASRCNIDCDYCYIYHLGDTGWARMPKTMSPETIAALTSSLADLAKAQGRGFAVVLHGGEPLLLGEQSLAGLLRGLRAGLQADCKLAIQTNGILLDRNVLDLCAETGTTVSVSLDGPRQAHDLHRLDFQKKSTFDRVIAGIQLLKAHPSGSTLFTGILTVIDLRTDPAELYGYFKSLGVPSVDFLLRDGNHTRYPVGKSSFDSVEYGSWLTRLWDVYMADSEPVPINILDDHTRLILGGHASKEGKGTKVYGIVVIDTDGTIAKNDTLKSARDGADRFRTDWSIHRDRLADVVRSAEFQSYTLLQHPTSEVCRRCPYLSVCGGGMPLFRWRDDNGYDNPSVYCYDHQYVIDHIRRSLPAMLRPSEK